MMETQEDAVEKSLLLVVVIGITFCLYREAYVLGISPRHYQHLTLRRLKPPLWSDRNV